MSYYIASQEIFVPDETYDTEKHGYRPATYGCHLKYWDKSPRGFHVGGTPMSLEVNGEVLAEIEMGPTHPRDAHRWVRLDEHLKPGLNHLALKVRVHGRKDLITQAVSRARFELLKDEKIVIKEHFETERLSRTASIKWSVVLPLEKKY